MSNLKEVLFWERFRPNTLIPEKGKIPIILLPRIRRLFENGLQFNPLIQGCGGQGKSSLVNILTEDYNTLKIDCSSKDGRSIDISEVIEDHCKNYSLNFKRDKKKKGDEYGNKVVWLEEFDNTTADMRKALRSFIEEHSDVRFIAIVNNLSKLQRTEEDRALLSRFNIINFDPENLEEINYIKNQQLSYLKGVSKAVKLDISDEVLKTLINKTYPNFRSTIQLLQEISITGDSETIIKNNKNLNQNVYDFILNGKNVLDDNFYYVAENFPKDKTEDLLLLLSRDFFKYLLENKNDIILKNGFKILDLMKEYNSQYTVTIDPEMHLVNYITKLKQLI